MLFFASSYFYSVFFWPFLVVLYFIITLDFVCGIQIEKATGKKKLFVLLISIAGNLGLLFFFKYFNFFTGLLEPSVNMPMAVRSLQQSVILLPIGLSFHTFQSLSYTIEVYRGKQKAERHIGYFANYVLFFPQMVAGPIERFERLGNELHKKHSFQYENISHGFKLILYGLFVKMCVADNLAPVVDQVYKNPGQYSAGSVLVAVLAFSVQIYADFYGYSTVACGAAKMMGIELMNNFKQPYFASSIQHFWQRWHISLSTWFRDYVFFPMGGNRVNTLRWVFNILVLFAVSGFWHGASYTFIIWGLLHAFFYLTESGVKKIFPLAQPAGIARKILGGLITFSLVSFAWIFFRAESFDKAVQVIRGLTGTAPLSGAIIPIRINYFFLVPVLMFVLFELFIVNNRFDHWLQKKNVSLRWSAYCALLVCILLLSGIKSYPFIYFQF